ncbi:MAG TPA: glycosyltransferase, partial [Candidatus Altiarchaeales archaeon]|nr:glycosyltransferase [Candidatus Altiarchaeales archaeon]
FKGKVSNEELRRCYQNCDVFVLPACIDSRGDTEGLGVVLLEAMSYKKPVIASNVGGIVDIVKDGETGLLVPEKNSQKLAEAIHTVLKNDELASRLGKQGYEFVSRNFNWARITDQLIEIYSQLAKQ